MRVAIGSDHAGFDLKEAVKTFLAVEHHEVVDVGTHSRDPVDYPDYAQAVGAALRESRAERGIMLCGSGITLFTDEKNAKALAGVLNGKPTLAGYLTAHLSRLGAGDYFALLAYIEMNDADARALQAMRPAARDARRGATCGSGSF